MKSVKIIAAFVMLIMTLNAVHVAVAGGMNHGVGLDTFLAGNADPWQAFINSDLVAGLILSLAWVIYRERGGRVIDTVAWVWLALWWGNIVVAAYVFHAANQSNGDWPAFFMGRRVRNNIASAAAPVVPAVRALCGAAGIGVLIYLVAALSQPALPAVAVAGYLAGFVPIILAGALLAMGRRR